MQTTWRATATLWLLAAAGGVAVSLLVAGGRSEPADWLAPATWLLLALIWVALLLSLDDRRRAERYRRHLVQGLTHHLRTSLAHIQAYNEMLLLGNDTSEEERQSWLEIVGREAERLGAAVENVLLLAGGPRERTPAARRTFDFGALVEDVAAAYEGPGGSRLSFDGEPPAGLMVTGDPATLKHALINLFEGLGGCSSPGGSLRASLTSDGDVATLKVGIEGNGTALRAARGQAAAPDVSASLAFGIELAVVEHVVRANGGRAIPFQETGRSGYRLRLPLAPS